MLINTVANLPNLILNIPNTWYGSLILFLSLSYWNFHVHFETRRFVEKSFISIFNSLVKTNLLFLLLFLVLLYFTDIYVANGISSTVLVVYFLDKSNHLNISTGVVVFFPMAVILIQSRSVIATLGNFVFSSLAVPSISVPITVLAALFAYLGWQETAINERRTVEQALSNRYSGRTYPNFSGHQIFNRSPKIEIKRIDVWKNPSKFKQIIKYLPTKSFDDTTDLRIKFRTSDETVTLSDLWRSLEPYNEILSISQYDDGEFSISISTTSITGVDNFIRVKLIGSIPGLGDQFITMVDNETGEVSQMVRRGSSEDVPLFYDDDDLDYGRRVAGKIEYSPISNILYLPLIFNELREIRKIIQSDNVYSWIYPDHQQITPPPVTTRGRVTDKVFKNRYFPTLRELQVPTQFRSLQPESRPEKYRTAIQGLEIVRRRFVDTEINGISKNTYANGSNYTTLEVSISPEPTDTVKKRINFNGVCHQIPVKNFAPSEFNVNNKIPDFRKGKYGISELMSNNLDAIYVFTNQYDIGVVYEHDDVFVFFLWDDRGNIELKDISSKLTEVLYPSVIWEHSE